MLETATQRKERLSKGISIQEAERNQPIEAVVVDTTDVSEIDSVKEELDGKGISYSPLAGLKSLKRKLKDN